MPRNPRHGFAALATLATILLLATLVLTLQTRVQSNIRIMARLTTDLQDRAARDSLHDRLRGLIADSMAGGAAPKLDGTPFILTEASRNWEVRVQDVEGLIDLYLAPPDVLAILPIDAATTTAAREQALASLQPGERFPVIAMTLARFRIAPEAVEGLVTQSSTTGSLRTATMPEILRVRAPNQQPGPREGEQITRVTIAITRAP